MKNNNKIEDQEIRSRPQTDAQININTGLAHFILTVKQLLLQCTQGSLAAVLTILLFMGYCYLGECATLREALAWLLLVILLRC
jgi:hypothetical protein